MTARLIWYLDSWYQPDPQAYPLPDGSGFPAQHGQATSFFQESGVQQEFAFIPDDGSNTYVINVETNTTQPLAAPSTKDAKATYVASITALVQLDSTGAVSFIPYKQGDNAANSAAKWASVAAISAVVPAGSLTSAGAPPASAGGASPTGPGASGAPGAAHPTSSKSGAPSGPSTPTTGAGNAQQTDGALANSMGSSVLAVITAGVFALSTFLL